MAEYIEREALLEDIENTLVFSGRPDHQNQKQMGARMVVQRIRSAPAADVASVVHGRWIISSDGYFPYCSECKNEPRYGVMSKHCPNCGARMDGGAADGV